MRDYDELNKVGSACLFKEGFYNDISNLRCSSIVIATKIIRYLNKYKYSRTIVQILSVGPFCVLITHANISLTYLVAKTTLKIADSRLSGTIWPCFNNDFYRNLRLIFFWTLEVF